MAYQVAQAYDENKNLVPLYVLTDGEIWNNYPETSNAFTFNLISQSGESGGNNQEYNYVISANAVNPVGIKTFSNQSYPLFKAEVVNSNMVGYSFTMNVMNDSAVKVRFSFELSVYMAGINTNPAITVSYNNQNDYEIDSGNSINVVFTITHALSVGLSDVTNIYRMNTVSITRLYS